MPQHVATYRAPSALLVLLAGLTLTLLPSSSSSSSSHAAELPTVEQVLDSGRDLWGESALKLPDGPSYEFFAPLLQPLRYCDAPFRHYPIALGAPNSPIKARLVSNGSAINALARQRNWIGETGTPVTFRVGRDMALFGAELKRLHGPAYEQGYLPVVKLGYEYDGYTYAEEVFVPFDEQASAHGIALVKLSVTSGPKDRKTKVEAQIEGYGVHKVAGGIVRDPDGKVLATFEPERWTYAPGRGTLAAELLPGESSVLAIYTKPADAAEAITPATYDAKRKACVEGWNGLLDRAAKFSTPEKIVNDAWRATVIANFMMLKNDEMRYSHGNQYDKLYIAEPADTVRALALYGQLDNAKAAVPPILTYTRKGLEYHQAALKCQMLAHVYFLTRDAEFVRSMRVLSETGRKPGWQTELDLLLTGREGKSGLFPPEKYAGDIEEHVYSLNSNSNGWRGLRDMSIVLEEIGEKELAKKAAASAAEFRKAVLAALDKSIFRDVDPPFVPLALFGAEKPYDRIYGVRLGSYWNIMSKYVLTSGVFPIDSDYADAIIHYAQQRGGLCMGMNRTSASFPAWWMDPRGINDLYGMRYSLALLERDEVDPALVGFYGKLAHGFTRDTFVGCEGASILPMYGDGRQMYLPPNSAANASYQQQLRYLMVQDWDTDDDGRHDTLRLAFGTPRRWLADGKVIAVERAPTGFGEVSYAVRSKLGEGKVEANVTTPRRAVPSKTLLRLRLPDGWKIDSAESGEKPLPVNGETLDISGLSGDVSVTAAVSKK